MSLFSLIFFNVNFYSYENKIERFFVKLKFNISFFKQYNYKKNNELKYCKCKHKCNNCDFIIIKFCLKLCCAQVAHQLQYRSTTHIPMLATLRPTTD